MAGSCEQLTELASAGVAPALRAVDCVSNEMAASAFDRLFGAHGAMTPVLTLLLSLYIAFFAFSLLTGRSRIGISALTPRMLTLGLALTFATSWIAYQQVVWHLAVGGPDWIASVLMGAKGSATQVFADRIDVVFGAIADAAGAAAPDGAQAGAQAGQAAKDAGGMFTPESVMWMGALLLLLGTVGVLLTARIVLGVMMALGPVFVVLGIFSGTRGLTAGWLRALVLSAVTPLLCVLAGSVTLELLVPILRHLVEGAQAGEIDGRAAMALFLVASVHVALMGMVLKVATTLVSGWRVFGLAADGRAGRGDAPLATSFSAPLVPAAAVGAAAAPGIPRHGVVARAAAASAVGVPHGGEAGAAPARPGDRRTVVTQVVGGGLEPMRPATGPDRARGIGSRFRNASNDAGTRPAKEMIR